MRFWLRELAGWALVLLGLGMFWLTFSFLLMRQIWEGGIMAGMAVFVFRGGIHLLKVAVAARICAQAQERLYPAPPASPRVTRGR